jgi:hypothetical protein
MMTKPDGKYSCGCGRSPTGKCIGWHALTEEAYQAKLAEWTVPQDESDDIEREKTINAELDAYRQQAMELWFDNGGSCTGAKPPTPNIN